MGPVLTFDKLRFRFRKTCFLMLIEASIVAQKLVLSSFGIPFYYGSGSGSVSGTGTVTVINYGSCWTAKPKVTVPTAAVRFRFRNTVMRRLDQGHLHPELEVPRQTCQGRGIAVGGEQTFSLLL